MTMMKSCMVKMGRSEEEGDEGVKDLIDMTLRKMDMDRDGRISFTDFQKTVTREPLMMEAFGPCLPNSTAGGSFVRKILESVPPGIFYYT